MADKNFTPDQRKQLGSALKGLSTALTKLQNKQSNTIKSDDLKSGSSFQLNQPSPSTQVDGALAGIESATGTDQFTLDLDRERAIAGANTQQSFEQYLDRLVNGKTRSGIESEVFAQDGGVDDLQAELDEINSQIMSEQHSLRRRLEKLDENPDGLFGGALTDEKNRISTDSLRKQADLAVIQMSRQGRFDSAKAIADRAVEAEFEQEQNITAAVKLNYEANKELFTTAEQRAFETRLNDRERKLNTAREDAKTLQNTKLNALQTAQANGAPLGIIQAIQGASTPEAVLQAGGKWASADLLAQEAQRASIAASNTNRLLALAKAGDSGAIGELGFDPREEPTGADGLDATTKRQLNTKLSGQNKLIGLVQQYRDLIDDKGYTNTIFGSTDTLGEIDSLRAQITGAYKEAESLGALDNGVIALVDQVIGDNPTSSLFGIGSEGNIFANLTGRRSARTVSSLDTLLNTAKGERDAVISQLGYTPVGNDVTFGLAPEEEDLINQQWGISTTSNNTTSSATFSPSNYFTQ